MKLDNKLSPIYLHGAVQEPTAPMLFRAGPVSMLFDPESANLRSIHYDLPDGQRLEILRGVYAAVRDQNWGTLAPQVSNLQVRTSAQGFSLQFQVDCSSSVGSFRWQGRLTGEASGKVCFDMAGKALSTFLRNRIGFCVLHPPELAGKACSVEHADVGPDSNFSLKNTFPQFISADQPMKNLRSITHQILPGLDAKVLMEGDSFEMEDQRNWTDASFKTYCTPLELPYPVEIVEGSEVCQSVTLTLQGLDNLTTSVPHGLTESPIRRLTLNPSQKTRIPKIGLGMSSSVLDLSQQEIRRLAALNLSHLRVDLRLTEHSWRENYDRAASIAATIEIDLEVALFLSKNANRELLDIQKHLTKNHAPIAAWLIFQDEEYSTSEKWIQLAREALAPIAALNPCKTEIQFVAGTDMNFAELNREHPPIESLDAVCFPINPQVHAFDNVSLVETLPMQAAVVESAKQFCRDLPIRITPITLRPRFNAVATGPSTMLNKGELPPQVDPRQLSLFGAAWTLGSLKHLAASRVHSITYYETVGWRGVQENEQGSACDTYCRELFPSLPASVFPLYHVLADVGEFVGGKSLTCESSSPTEFEGLALSCHGRRRLILASYIGQEQVVLINLSDKRDAINEDLNTARLQRLDRHSFMEATCTPELFRSRSPRKIFPNANGDMEVKIPPHSIVRIDF